MGRVNIKSWLLFLLGAAAVFVAFLAVVQLGEFNSNFHSKDFYDSSSPPVSAAVVPLSRDRFAVVQGDDVTVYAVDGQGRLTIKDSIGALYAPSQTKQRHNFSIKAPEPEAGTNP
jgi:hypothetical protein